jgi:hypothetical protein
VRSAAALLMFLSAKRIRWRVLFSCSSADMCSRLEMCLWINYNPILFVTFFFAEEARFTRYGVNNTRNSRLWDRDNPHGTVESNYQQRFSANVWCGVVSLVTISLVRTFSRNVLQVTLRLTLCKMYCQHY